MKIDLGLAFFPITDIVTYRLNQPRGQIILSEMQTKMGRYRWGYQYNLFQAYTAWTQDQLSLGRHPHKDLK